MGRIKLRTPYWIWHSAASKITIFPSISHDACPPILSLKFIHCYPACTMSHVGLAPMFSVVVEVPHPDAVIKSGAFARVTLTVGEQQNVLLGAQRCHRHAGATANHVRRARGQSVAGPGAAHDIS